MTAEERLALRLLMTEFPLEETYVDCRMPMFAKREAMRGCCAAIKKEAYVGQRFPVRDPETLTDDDLRKFNWLAISVPVAGEPGRWMSELVFRADYASWASETSGAVRNIRLGDVRKAVMAALEAE